MSYVSSTYRKKEFIQIVIEQTFILKKDYISKWFSVKEVYTEVLQEEEKIILKELMDMVAKNMGKPFKTKLELYYGIGHIEDLLAQKCYIRVAMYVADANKNIYADDNGEKDKLTKEVMKQMMMNK